ncbi:adenylate/guanylate cyclase domain-containing protein [Neptuniibacter sp.]|uniref:adenylate/guanylate cyclase domain-containing protein n=1 Tax=Neptuniibacter sp. TaxID=1962643 RepID=UPI002637B3D3|nr:adenylate/guanylate cyclase domain-containing protein [Neptuniibacter sp.]MCP4596469.1 adenylate/guanylate cyclase domain-containing protein [Neptuniibacter sp.]
MKLLNFVRFDKVGKVRVIPVALKIVVVLTLFIIVSNLTTNYISLVFNRINQVHFTKQLLIKDLKEISNFSNIQWQIFEISQDRAEALANIKKKSLFEIENQSSVILGFEPNGDIVFSTLDQKGTKFDMQPLLEKGGGSLEALHEDFVVTEINGKQYFGIYKYNKHWDMYLFRGEDDEAYHQKSWQNFLLIILIILLITVLSAVTAIYVVRYILRFISTITHEIMDMTKKQKLAPIPLENAPNDDVTYMGMSFNVLSHNMDVLVNIFKKFADRDIVKKAYEEKEIRLEGDQQQLTMLFTDIKGYTNMTETLGTDIIKLLNIQYDHAIANIYEHEGVIASIIGDALLAVYGVMDHEKNKSYAALLSAHDIIRATESLKTQMEKRKQDLIAQQGSLTEQEEAIYQAVLLDVGVGIDCGDVFYGTIGSQLRMTTTVIGDRVNSASRLEGLTRIYKVPMICSDSVRDDVLQAVAESGFKFINIDSVKVKGKNEALPIYWPVPIDEYSDVLQQQLKPFEQGLNCYYQGDWQKAHEYFCQCALPVADEFKQRTSGQCPGDWDGTWVLTSK